MQTVNGCRVRMDRRRFRDFMQDNLDISSELLSDRIFRFFNKVSEIVSLYHVQHTVHCRLVSMRTLS